MAGVHQQPLRQAGTHSPGVTSPPASPGLHASPTHEASALRTLFKGKKSLVSSAGDGGIAGGGGGGAWDLSAVWSTGSGSARADQDLSLSSLVARRNSHSATQMATMRNSQPPISQTSGAGGESPNQYRTPPSLLGGGSPRSSIGPGTEVLQRSSSFLSPSTSNNIGFGGSLLIGLGRSHTLSAHGREGSLGDLGGAGEEGELTRRQSSFSNRQQSFSGMVRPSFLRGGSVSGGEHLQSQTHEALQKLMSPSSGGGGASRGSQELGAGSLSVGAGSGGSFSSGSSGAFARGSSGFSLSSVSMASTTGVGSPQHKLTAKGVLGSVVDRGLGLFRSERSSGVGTASNQGSGIARTQEGPSVVDADVGRGLHCGPTGGQVSGEGCEGEERGSDPSSEGEERELQAGDVAVADESY
ncbi:MAG: hypothetical protein WDW38_009080 [Sanguina aurantia]